MLAQILSSIGSIASIITLGAGRDGSWGALTNFQWMTMFLGIFVAVATTFQTWTKRKVKKFKLTAKGKRRINGYLKKWISQGGRVAIFSRDMSWAKDQDLMDLLGRKVRNHELSVFVPRSTHVTDELVKLSSDSVVAYANDFNFVPSSRFTIINDGRADSKSRSAIVQMAIIL